MKSSKLIITILIGTLLWAWAVAGRKSIDFRLNYEVGTASPFMTVPRIQMHHITGDPEELWMKVPAGWVYEGLYRWTDPNDPNDVTQFVRLSPKTAPTAEPVYYYINGASKIYHRAGCRYVKDSSNRVTYIDGLKPCSVCKPSQKKP